MKKFWAILIALFGVFFCAFSITQRSSSSLPEVFEQTSKMEGFEMQPVSGGDWGFPYNIGHGRMCIHPNGEPHDKIARILSKLPEGWLVFEDSDGRGAFARMYCDDENRVLYVIASIGSGDMVMILFEGGEKEAVDSFISQVKQQVQERHE